MTDLERLWESLTTRPAPVEDILRAGRRSVAVRRRKVLLRPLVAAGAVAALAAAFVAGTTIHGSSGGGSGSTASGNHAGPGGSDASPVAFQADLKPAASCDDLLKAYRDRGLALVTAYGWGGGFMRGFSVHGVAPGPMLDQKAAPAAPQAGLSGSVTNGPSVKDQGSSATGTNVQEVGVDEPDTVKTDGHLLVRVQDGTLEVYDVTGATPRLTGTLALDNLESPQLLLDGSTVVVLGGDTTASPNAPKTTVLQVSLSDPANPRVASITSYRSTLLSARQHGDIGRIVLDAGLPALDFVQPGDNRTEKQALDANRALVEKSTLQDWLPSYDAGHGAQPLLDCHDVAVPPAALGLDTVSIVGFPIGSTANPTPHAIGIAGATSIAYESADDLYLAAAPSYTGGCVDRCIMPGGPIAGGPLMGMPPRPTGDAGKTYLFDFRLDGLNAIHVASGAVTGSIRDRWSMDSANGTLRVAVGRSDATKDANSIVTFKRVGQRLVEDGRLDNLGVHQDIQSVRWFDDLAILVTYRPADPMYTIDLTDPARPRLLGALELPGYSSYLHPLSSSRVLGVGSTGREEAQIGLFDVTDLKHVRRLSTVGFGPNTYALAGQNPVQFTWLPTARIALTVIQHGNAGDLAVVHLDHGRLDSHLVPIGFGSDVYDARTLPLPDGRVALSTGKGVSFLPL